MEIFRGPVTDGRYDELRYINHDSDMTDIELGRFGFSREADRGRIMPQFYPNQVAFTVPYILDWEGLAQKGIRYFHQPWDMGGCDLSPAEAVT